MIGWSVSCGRGEKTALNLTVVARCRGVRDRGINRPVRRAARHVTARDHEGSSLVRQIKNALRLRWVFRPFLSWTLKAASRCQPSNRRRQASRPTIRGGHGDTLTANRDRILVTAVVIVALVDRVTADPGDVGMTVFAATGPIGRIVPGKAGNQTLLLPKNPAAKIRRVLRRLLIDPLSNMSWLG